MGNIVQSLLWPRIVPIDGRTVDDRGELQASRSEVCSDWRECEYNMQSFSAKLDEIGVDVLSCVWNTGCLGFIRKFLNNLDLLIWQEEIGDFTTVEQVIDILEEGLPDNLVVSKEELCDFFVDGALTEESLDVVV